MNVQLFFRSNILTLIFSSILYSHTIPSGRISGFIQDMDTEEPIFYTNVFLANTTLGVASDENGYFKIENIPPGDYDIVFSHIGYEIQIIPIEITFKDYIITNMDIQLKSRVLKGEEVKIETEEPKEWRKNLERFTRIFIGETDNAKRCKIINPEVLDFQVDPVTDVMIALSEDVIKVENRALGYNIEIILINFEWETDDKGSYTIYPFFKEMKPENDKEKQEWIANRYNTYEGSERHFLSSLVVGNVEENQFYLYEQKSNYRKSYNLLAQLDPDSIQFTLIDTLRYVKRFFYYGILTIHHGLNERSYLKLIKQYADIDIFGNKITPFALKTDGYWATLRVADILPRNYKPYK